MGDLRLKGQSFLLSQPLWGLLHPRKKGYGIWVIPSQKVYKHKAPPSHTQTSFSLLGGRRRRHAYSESRVKTTSCALSPPRKYPGEAGWGEAGETTGTPQEILQWYKKSHAAPTHFTSWARVEADGPGLPWVLQCRCSRHWQLSITAEFPILSQESTPRVQDPAFPDAAPSLHTRKHMLPQQQLWPLPRNHKYFLYLSSPPWEHGVEGKEDG